MLVFAYLDHLISSQFRPSVCFLDGILQSLRAFSFPIYHLLVFSAVFPTVFAVVVKVVNSLIMSESLFIISKFPMQVAKHWLMPSYQKLKLIFALKW
jgi:hypothetical protein